MTSPSPISTYLFRATAIWNVISIGGHIIVGRQNLDPTLKTLNKTPEQRVAAAFASNGWDYMNAGFAILAAYYWRFSHTGGPQTFEEKVTFWALFVASIWAARRCIRVGMYGPLSTVLVSPLVSLGAWWLA